MPVAIPARRRDPTGTATIRETYAQRLRGAFADLNTLIRAGVRERDVFGLRVDTLQEDDLPPLVRLDRDPRKREVFDAWLQERIDADVLTAIDRDDNRFVRAAYERGLKDADRFLGQAGITDGPWVGAAFDLPVHERTVENLFATNYSDLEDITQEMSRQIGSELAEGFARGEGPDAIAGRITDRVDKIGKTRATTLARTRVVGAHADATLNRYEQFGITNVEVRAEWMTAGDARVCPICQNLAGQTWTTQAARTATVTLEEADVADAVPEDRSASDFTGTFPVKPPAHVNCRCAIVPSLT
jgi:SPP1 gp7 family putative phage head morphogenesis protein